MITGLPRRKRMKLGDEVTGHLRAALVSGVFLPGQRLIIEDLAERLDVSAMPVREALVALANEGLVDVLPNKGFRAVAVTRQDIGDVFTLTAFTGGMLVQRAASSITATAVSQLHELQRRIERTALTQESRRRFRAIEVLNRQLHETIITSADSKRLQWFYRAAVRITPRFEGEERWVAAQVEDHPGLIAALERHDGPLAKKLAEAHSNRVADVVLKHLERTGFWNKDGQGRGGLSGQLPAHPELVDIAFD